MHNEKPSKTARKVALNILVLGEIPEVADVLPPGVVEATAQLLLASGAVSEKSVRLSRTPWMVRVYRAFDWMLPGQFVSFAHRKAFCECQVREGIGAGASQVLVLGAGYDTMGWRLAPHFPAVDFFEIDHPATAAVKAKGIEAMDPRPNLHLIAADLGEHRLVDVLSEEKRWDRTAQAVFVAEGLLQYLPPLAVHDLFTQCAAVATKSRFAFTYIPKGPDGRPDAGPWTHLVLWILKNSGEPWRWSISPEELGSFLEATGWCHAPEFTDGTRHGVELYAVATTNRRKETVGHADMPDRNRVQSGPR